MNRPDVLVIGLGNPSRGDDGVGRKAALELRRTLNSGTTVLDMLGEASELIDAWKNAGKVVLIDACQGLGKPGDVRRVDLLSEDINGNGREISSHGLGLQEAVNMALALGDVPRELILVGIEAATFEHGDGLSNKVKSALPKVFEMVAKELAESKSVRESESA